MWDGSDHPRGRRPERFCSERCMAAFLLSPLSFTRERDLKDRMGRLEDVRAR